jgi:hypothetical protein
MSCNVDRHKYILNSVADGYGYGHVQVTEFLWGKDILGHLAIAVLLLPLVVVFVWAQYILVPRFVMWYYEKNVTEKAKEEFKKGLSFLGFRRSTVVISVIAGAIFYAAIKIAFAVPDYYLRYSVPSLIVVFALIALIGLLVSGKRS